MSCTTCNNLMSTLKKSRLIHLSIGISFFVSGLLINLLQFCLFVCLRPFNVKLYRKLNYYLCYSLYCQLVFLADWWSNTKLTVYCDGDIFTKDENVLLMMNHTYEIDWLLGWIFCEKRFVLGNCKAFAKKVIRYIPIIGWCWYFAEFVFLERSFEKDKEIIATQLKEAFSYPDPVWLLLNAEGTRFTESKHEASVQFAKERGMTVLKHHLIPRTKGFTASLPTLKKYCHAIYDINLSVKKDDPVPPTIRSLLFGNSVDAYMFVRRIPMKDVPSDENEAAAWLQNLFVEKDKIQDSFHTTGDYFKTSGFKETKSFVQKRRIYPLLNVVGWLLVTVLPLIKFMFTSLIYGNWFSLTIVSILILILYVIMRKSIGMSEIRKASKYGMNNHKKD
ncbi:1-acyl-sn-glycerol-3-phosphate acyltransferase gamma-like [Condylostylus longicornis]|uniref:1-acyl-sn-glycerol-3-phosphate acyltransferase gamma-like n=1 Tax=Condylostylus longicornis TaxID=2530218 RepID=UPI00244E1DAD|nr:1-acyl-sn-glycerol-3-phosphate acyltransferase gamma-like [Condylostylus longicornis]XP_055382545.1 1-acyl-sn-glycerol-3-phosphate acyltransferase gamma-like [Condylostylus longicornis]